MNLIDLFNGYAESQPDTTAVIDARREVTYRRLADLAERGAAGLTRLGLEPGDHVFVMVPMSVELYVVVLALLRAGLVATFADPSAGSHVITARCERVKPRAFVGSAKAQLLTLTHPALRRIPVRLNTGFAWRGARWPTQPGTHTPIPVLATHAAIVTCTSGATGIPKIACRSHGFLLNQHTILVKTTAPTPGRRELVTLPVVALSTLGSGQTLIVPDADLRRPGNVNPVPVLSQVARHKPATVIASPAFIECLTRAPEASDALTPVTRVITGGGPVFPSLCERIEMTFTNAALVAVYGSTEAEPIAELDWRQVSASDQAAMTRGRGLLAGCPVPDIDIRILKNRFGTDRADLTSAELATESVAVGEIGEIVVSGPHVLRGYLDGQGDPETKFRIDDQVWHRTGDAGAFDAEGRLWLAGRADQAVTDERGECYPFAVETAAMSLPGVRRAAFAAADGIRWLLYERSNSLGPDERLALAWAGIDRFANTRIPVDSRHNSKIDHRALSSLLRTLASSAKER